MDRAWLRYVRCCVFGMFVPHVQLEGDIGSFSVMVLLFARTQTNYMFMQISCALFVRTTRWKFLERPERERMGEDFVLFMSCASARFIIHNENLVI